MTALELPAASALASSFAPGILLNLGGAALRALAAAGVAGAALSLLRVRNVLAQKTAWSVVLAGAILMPLLAPWAARQGWIPTRIPFQLSSASSAAAWAQARLASIRLARQTAPITSSPTSSATTSLDTRLAEPTAVPPLTVDERLAAPAIAPEKTAPLAAPISFASMPQETSTTHALTGPIGPQLPTPVTPPRPVSALSTAINTIWPLYLLIAAALLVRLFYGFARCAAPLA